MSMSVVFTSQPSPHITLLLDTRKEKWYVTVLKYGVPFDNVVAISDPFSNAPTITEVVSFPEIQGSLRKLIDLARITNANYELNHDQEIKR